MHRIEVRLKPHLPDPAGLGLLKDIRDLGITAVSGVRVCEIYWLDAELAPETLDLICRSVLADGITQDYRFGDTAWPESAGDGVRVVEVAYNAGVTGPIEDSIVKALRDLGVSGVRAVKTSRQYLLKGDIADQQLDEICSRLLVNPTVQHIVTEPMTKFLQAPQYQFALKEVTLLGRDEAGLEEVGRQFGFSAAEIGAVAAYFKGQGRNPTDVELETLAQTWSEHCVHKTFKGKINYNGETIDNLLKSTVMRVTRELARPWCLSVFEDNAGAIDFDGRWALCFKVETHNHPSAVEPYGGASTGIGGVVRDPLGTGLGAKPILNTDVFCFAPPDFPFDKLPRGVLHPRRIFKGVRAGVADYGNRLGIPTLNGAVLFDERYVANPLVFCGTLGLMPAGVARRGKQEPGDLVVLVGGRTGRDGIHGVTFASEQLTDESTEVSSSSVQIGNPIVEKRLIDVILQARERRLFRRITDCGGGGLSSAVGEMAAETGVRVYLEKVPLKYAGLAYDEIWISESQERMILAVPPEHIDELLKLFASEDVETAVIGEFADDKRLKLFYEDNLVGDLEMEFLHEGIPQPEMTAVWELPKYEEPDFAQPSDLSEALKAVLSSWNVCSKEWVIRQYDHEVQGASVLKPLVGKDNDGPGDAAIVRPVLDSDMGVIVANGINPVYGEIDPYWMAAAAIDEALRQIVAVGGSLKRVALLDNFCWGNTARPETLGALVRAARACYDMARIYGTPFISGKDSLNNEFAADGEIIVIPHTLLISAVGVMNDVSKAVSMDFKADGDLIYVVGDTGSEMGGSAYLGTLGFTGNNVPRVDPQQAKRLMDALSLASEKGLVKACHDCSEGGIGVAVSEMAFAGGFGAEVNLRFVPLGELVERDDYILFSESNSRFIVEVAPENKNEFEKVMAGVRLAAVGRVSSSGLVEVFGVRGDRVLSASIEDLKEAWQKPLRW